MYLLAHSYAVDVDDVDDDDDGDESIGDGAIGIRVFLEAVSIPAKDRVDLRGSDFAPYLAFRLSISLLLVKSTTKKLN